MNTTTAAVDAAILRALLDGVDCKIRGNKVTTASLRASLDVRDTLKKADLSFKESFVEGGQALRFTVL